ncbi:hypothetical protein ILUMI_20656 [Ignelater luminosus]|uniref:Uncharacterized protein n=1 Tax=Ignelater luminosus TaxID=2038154 RepID=A0A8K0CI08_IGNLU|nr:hypothetical protein ILUMI_20656 [Ignelater luminosus]
MSQNSKSVKNYSTGLSWDADLRALAAPSVVRTEINVSHKRKRSEDLCGTSKKPKENLNKTEEDAAKIEMALNELICTETIDLVDPVNPLNPVNPVKENKEKNTKSVTKRRDRVKSKKSGSVNKAASKNEKEVLLKLNDNNTNTAANNSNVVEKQKDEEAVAVSVDGQQNVSNRAKTPEKQYSVINRHVKPRIKKKCNTENCSKKLPTTEEIVLTNITKIKSCEILDDGKNKLILSPSKLNANKRSLVETENKSSIEVNVIAKNTDNETGPQDTTTNKLITPESTKIPTNSMPTIATGKRNIMPTLETPMKSEAAVILPKTPGRFSPSTIDTPFTKAVIDQLTGVDINMIPTPKFPITPNFPFTPATDHQPSPFPNRATDYSTSSSYYQPSDTEQNKSLEQLIEECRRLEKQPSIEVSESQEKTEESGNKTENVSTNVQTPENLLKTVENVATSVADKTKAFNHSMIGKKNLQLVKIFSNDAAKCSSSDDSSTGSESDNTSSEDSDSDDSTYSDDNKKESPNKTVSPYLLRSRKAVTPNVTNTKDKNQKPAVDTQQGKPAEKQKEKPLTFQDGLLQEMEEKRQRTIAKFKDALSAKPKRNNVKPKKEASKPAQTKAKTAKTNTQNKSVARQNMSETKKPSSSKVSRTNKSLKSKQQKLDSSKKAKTLELPPEKKENYVTINPVQSTFIKTKQAKALVDDDEIIFHLSSDDENLKPFEMVETQLLEYSTSSTSTCDESKTNVPPTLSTEDLPAKSATIEGDDVDQEAESLVKGLKQWGIHLIPNKSNKKNTTETPDLSKESSNSKNEGGSKEKLVDKKSDVTEESTEKSKKVQPRVSKHSNPSIEKPLTHNLEITNTVLKGKKVKEKLNVSKQTQILKQRKENSEPSIESVINSSLEEGELISDDESKVNNSNQVVQLYNTDTRKKVSSIDKTRRNSDSTKEIKKQNKNRLHSNKLSRNRSRSESKPEGIQINLPTKPDDSKKESYSEKLSKLPEKTSEVQATNKSSTVPSIELDYSIQFDVKVYAKETHKIVHDYSKKINRKITDYNLDILSKQFSANVYIAEIDSEVEKFISFSPFESLLDIPSKTTSSTTSKDTNVSLPASEEQLKKKQKPLTILYNQLIKPAEDIIRPSPLQDLYSSAPTSSRNLKQTGEDKIMDRSRKSERLEKTNKSKQKDLAKENKISDDSSKTEQEKDNLNLESTKAITMQDESSTNKVKELEVRDGVIMLNSTTDKQPDENEKTFEINDELMNYALVGSERIEENDDTFTMEKRKRKPSESAEIDIQSEKKQKTEVCQELLRNIDVDSFLKKLHGET